MLASLKQRIDQINEEKKLIEMLKKEQEMEQQEGFSEL